MIAPFADHIGADELGHLRIEDCDAVELADRFGTPLYAISEAQLRTNLRRFHAAFASIYPGAVEVLFSNKANYTPAVSAVLAQEGAGAECYTEGELRLALLGGVEPARIVLNDADKPLEYVRDGIERGCILNVDGIDEFEPAERLAREIGRPARIFIRLRLSLEGLDAVPNEWAPRTTIGEVVRAYKLGAHWEAALEICDRARASDAVELLGLHFHLGRWTNTPRSFCLMIEELVDWMARLRDETGWSAGMLNIGGGFVHARPEGGGPRRSDTSVPSIEEFASEIGRTLTHCLSARSLALPHLQLEPGSYLTHNAGVLLTRVGVVREWPERYTWVHLDAHGVHLPRVDSPQDWYYHAVAANKLDAPLHRVVELVGRGCNFEILGSNRPFPALDAGDLVAFLDAGAYTETKASQMNAAPRPASILVTGDAAEVITERETLEDVIGRFRVPERLRRPGPWVSSTGSAA